MRRTMKAAVAALALTVAAPTGPAFGSGVSTGGTVRTVQEVTDPTFEIVPEVTTGTTDCVTGARDGRWSNWSSFTAPPGWRLIRDQISYTWRHQRGSENHYQVDWGDWIYPFPGAPDVSPKTIRVRVHARSSSGRCGGSGKSVLAVSGRLYAAMQDVPAPPPPA
ncbi:hypothetical protein [Actinoplanes sp. NPDC023714]|uniref:hypothetical protein n=1 Tax=Actinoplanes sp. NPDC023714 TaxID=3154322 RepID=UPI0033F134A3